MDIPSIPSSNAISGVKIDSSFNKTANQEIIIEVTKQVLHDGSEVDLKFDQYQMGNALSPEGFELQRGMITEQMTMMLAQSKEDSPTHQLQSSYQTISSVLEKEMPEVLKKDWDFSVDADGGIVLKDADDLSKPEQEKLTTILNDYGIGKKAGEYANVVTKMIELDRGVNGYSTNIGKYDLSRENFDQLINLRDIFEKSDEHIGMSHLEDIAGQLALRGEEKYQLTYTKSAWGK